MVHWRNFFSSPSEIDPVIERLIKHTVFCCLYSNGFVITSHPLREVEIAEISRALNIFSSKFEVQIKEYLKRYPLRTSIAAHLQYLHIELKRIYEEYGHYTPIFAFFVVLCLGLEVIYLLWSKIPLENRIEYTYATVSILCRLFSGREFTRQYEVSDISNFAFRNTVQHLRFPGNWNHPLRLYDNLLDVNEDFLDDIPRPDDRFSPDSPISAPSWPDSGVLTISPSVASTPATTSPSTIEVLFPGYQHSRCMPRLRRFIPRMCRVRCIPRIFPRTHALTAFRRFFLSFTRHY